VERPWILSSQVFPAWEELDERHHIEPRNIKSPVARSWENVWGSVLHLLLFVSVIDGQRQDPGLRCSSEVVSKVECMHLWGCTR